MKRERANPFVSAPHDLMVSPSTRYIPSPAEALKFAWIQYLAIFVTRTLSPSPMTTPCRRIFSLRAREWAEYHCNFHEHPLPHPQVACYWARALFMGIIFTERGAHTHTKHARARTHTHKAQSTKHTKHIRGV